MKNKSRSAYNKIAKNYDNSFDGKITKKFRKRLLEQIVVDDEAVVLDIACGNGRFLEDLFNTIPNAKGNNFYGVDISENMIYQAKKTNPDFNFSRGDICTLPFENEKFDLVTVTCSLHHFVNLKSFFKEVRRVLKVGGMFVIVDFTLPAVIRNICNIYLPLSPKGDYKFYSTDEIAYTLEQVGFDFAQGDIDIEKNAFWYQIAAFK